MSDLYAAVEQSMVDKIVNEATYPMTIINQWWDFPGNLTVPFGTVISKDQLRALLNSASNECGQHWDELPCRVKQARVALQAEVQRVKAYKARAGDAWKGPSDEELETISALDVEFKPHLTPLRLDIRSAPVVHISGMSTVVKGVALTVEAIGQLWWKHPEWVCTKDCNIGPIHFCCEGHFEDKWGMFAEVSVNDVHIVLDATVSLIEDHLVVYAVPSVDRLVLDYPILRELNLAPLVNDQLADKRMPLIDVRSIVAALPYVNTKYAVHEMLLSGNGEIRVDITVQLIP